MLSRPLPITTSQFLDHFQRAWTESRLSWAGRQVHRIPCRLGLAVSGGADSMALAYLCKELETQNLVDTDKPNVTVTAFVVDHKARAESSQEARTVAGWLTEMGIQSQILELEWPSSHISAFETHARRLRFQALGRACRDLAIPALLMGHHQDDNVETTIWRLACGARGAGLAGIPSLARIPECHGLYGVAESGERKMIPEASSRCVVATGGILICRPLLSFPKAALLETCRHHRIPYVSDPTNFDPTLTPRNAIRSLLGQSRLPRALQPPSILSLINTTRSVLETALAHSNDLLQQCRLHDFIPASGTMLISFPSASTASTEEKDRQIQSLTLRRITDLIAPHPENHFPLHSFEKFVSRVFGPPPSPTPSPSSTSSSTSSPDISPFTLAGIIFHPEKKNKWRLSRQPFMRHRLPTLTLRIPISGSEIYSSWGLWDNRFWVRGALVPDSGSDDDLYRVRDLVRSRNLVLVVRPLQRADLQTIRRMVGERPDDPVLGSLLERLAVEAPGQTRFTIPVLVMEQDCQGQKSEVLLALPTLDCRLPSATQAQELLPSSTPWTLQWEWMFKSIDDVPLKLMGWL